MQSLRIFVLLLLKGFVTSQSGSDVKNLLTKLFVTDGYDKNIRPLLDQRNPVDIYLDFFLKSVIEFNEQDESLKTSGYIEAIWFDEYLTWNSSDFNGVTSIFLPQDDVWKPDLSLSNTFATFRGMGSSYLNVQVNNNGEVRWQPSMIFESTCAVNIKYFPFDTQTCDLKFTAWSYRKIDVEIHEGSKGVVLMDFIDNAAWDLVSSSTSEVVTDEVAVVFTLDLKRRPLFFLINIIGPVILLSVLNIFTFLLPVESGEKAGYSITVFLSLAVFLTIISDQLPNNSDTVSLMAIYLTMMVLLSTLVVIICLLQIRLSIRKESDQPVTFVFSSIVKLANRLQCRRQNNIINVEPINNDKNNKELQDDIKSEPEVKEVTWINVIHAMDFLCFWLAAIYTFFCTTIIAIVATSNAQIDNM